MIRHRGVQAVAIAALAGLATACACLAPIYDRGIQQALLHTQLLQHSAASLALTLESSGSHALATDDLVTLPTRQLRRYFGKPAEYSEITLTKQGKDYSGLGGVLAASAVCSRLRFVAGHCPHGMLDAAVSTADAKNFGWKVGQRVAVTDSSDPTAQPVYSHMRVVGIFAAPQGHAPGLPTVGLSGITATGASGASGALLTDDWVVAPQTIGGSGAPPWLAPNYTAAFPLRNSLALDELAPLARRIASLEKQTSVAGGSVIGGDGLPGVAPGAVYVHTSIPDVAKAVAHGRDQAQVTVPLLVVQLAVLAVVVFWLVLGAATEQRRPEVALARLRGRGAGGARRLLLAELVPIGVAGVFAGAVLAAAASFPIRWWVLPGDAPFELRLPFWWVLLISLAVVLVSIVVAAGRVVREPVSALLRRVPTRRTGWALGVVDALVVAATAVVVIAFFSGALTGPLAQAAPTLLALLVGLVLAHVVVPLGAAIGGRLASRGRVGLGVGLLQVARRTSTRRVIALVTVASALLVFAADAYQVGGRNRAYAAEQQNGAPLVAQVDGTAVNDVLAALRSVDPDGQRVTPVVTVPSSGNADIATVAAFPDAFRRIGLFPGQQPASLPWRSLGPPEVPAIHLVGGGFSFELSSQAASVASQYEQGGFSNGPLQLAVRYNGSDGFTRTLQVGSIPAGTTRPPHRVQASVPCEKGCDITGLGIAGDPGEEVSGTVTITGLRSSTGQQLTLGASSLWTAERNATGQSGHQGAVKPDPDYSGPGLRADFDTKGSTQLMMGYAWVPARVPALVTGTLPGGKDHGTFSGLGLDAVERPMTAVASVPRLPGSPPHTRFVNLTTLLRDGAEPDNAARIQVWFAHDDPALLQQVTKALQQRGVMIAQTTSLRQVRAGLDASAPAWGLLLAVLVGAVGLAIAGLVLVVVAVTGWRARAKDLAALRMSGLRARTLRRVALAEQLPIVVLAVVAGAVCGAVGAHYSLPSVPLLPQPPEVSALDITTAWVAVFASGFAALVALCVVGWIAAVALARRATLERVREEV